MVSKVPKDKKGRRKQKVKKEIEIPVYVVNKNSDKFGVFSKKKSEAVLSENQNVGAWKIIKDDDDLPVLENAANAANDDFNLSEIEFEKSGGAGTADEWRAAAEKSRKKEREKTVEGVARKKIRKIHLMSEESKRKIMWISVVLIVSMLFFIWFAVFKNNFSFYFNKFNFQNNIVLPKTENSLDALGSQWDTLRSQWSEFQGTLKEKVASSANEQILNKLKEKILVEELKNKLAD